MALTGSVRVVAEVQLDFSDVSGPPPPDTHTHETQSHRPLITTIQQDFQKAVR